MKDFSYITNSSPAFIENLYHDFLNDPDSVDPELKKFFEGFDFAMNLTRGNGHVVSEKGETKSAAVDITDLAKEFAVFNLILAYRKKGHLVAKTNPIRERKDRGANLDLKYFGLTGDDLNREFESGKFVGLGKTSLQLRH